MSDKAQQLKNNIKYAQFFKLGVLVFDCLKEDRIYDLPSIAPWDFVLRYSINNKGTIENVYSQLFIHYFKSVEQNFDLLKAYKYKFDFQWLIESFSKPYMIADKWVPHITEKADPAYPIIINRLFIRQHDEIINFLIDDYIVPSLKSERVMKSLNIDIFKLIVSITRMFILTKQQLDKLILAYIEYLQTHSFLNHKRDCASTTMNLNKNNESFFTLCNAIGFEQHMFMNCSYHKFWWNITEHQLYFTNEMLMKYLKYIPSVYHFGNLIYINPNKHQIKENVLHIVPYQVKDYLTSPPVRSLYGDKYRHDGSLHGQLPESQELFFNRELYDDITILDYHHFCDNHDIANNQIWKINIWSLIQRNHNENINVSI